MTKDFTARPRPLASTFEGLGSVTNLTAAQANAIAVALRNEEMANVDSNDPQVDVIGRYQRDLAPVFETLEKMLKDG